jgi:hypothetical protein
MFSARPCARDPPEAQCRKMLTPARTRPALGGRDRLSNLERWQSEFDSDARVFRRFEQFAATTSESSIASTRRRNSSDTAMPLRAGNSSPLSRIIPTAGRM